MTDDGTLTGGETLYENQGVCPRRTAARGALELVRLGDRHDADRERLCGVRGHVTLHCQELLVAFGNLRRLEIAIGLTHFQVN